MMMRQTDAADDVPRVQQGRRAERAEQAPQAKHAPQAELAEQAPRARRARLSAAERRETILRAAAEVFAESGYRSAKVSDVAARVGVTEPVIFQNFGSKAALFAAVVGRAAAEAKDSLDELVTGSVPASELLAHVLASPDLESGVPAHAPVGPDGTEPGHTAPEDARSDGGRHSARDRARSDDGGPSTRSDGGRSAAASDGGAGHAGTVYGVLFADAAALAAEPELAGPARDAVRAVAEHLADLVRHAQAGGGARPDTDPEAAAWLLLSILAARRMRAAAMPDGVESAVVALALQSIAQPERGEPPA